MWSQSVFDAIISSITQMLGSSHLLMCLLLIKYPTGAFKLCPLMVTGMMPMCLGHIFKGDFTTAVLCCCSQFLVSVRNEPSPCMNNCLSESQLYHREYLFCISKPNKILVTGSLSHIMKVWENLKLALGRCKVAFISEVIYDPSAVFRCTAAGSILVL